MNYVNVEVIHGSKKIMEHFIHLNSSKNKIQFHAQELSY